MIRKSSLLTIAALFVLMLSVTGATAQEPQSELAVASTGCVAGDTYDPACDVDHNGEVNVVDLELVASHWGQSGTWTASGLWSQNDGDIYYDSGNVGIGTSSPLAQLHVNAGGADESGVRIENVGFDGVSVLSTGGHGVFIDDTGLNGVNVASAGEDGVSVFEAGNPSTTDLSMDNNGFEVSGAEGHGLYVGRADLNGVEVFSATTGISVNSVFNDGVQIQDAGDAGVEINSADNEGVVVQSVGSPSTTNSTSASTGFEVHGSDSFGAWVGRADADGVQVNSAGDDGFEVLEAGGAGFQARSAANHGVFVGEVGSPSASNSIGAKSGFEVQGSAGNGLSVGRADGAGVVVRSAGGNGVFVDEAGFHGVSVGSTDEHGVFVNSAGAVGLFVNSADDDGIFVEDADADGDGLGMAGYFDGDVTVTGNLSKGSGSFKIDHPLDPENKYLYHSFVESPDRMNVYNGNVTTDEEGYATVTLPDYFAALNRDYRYQLTVIGTFAQAIVAEEIENNQFVIQTDEPNVKVSWQVTGIRQDPYAKANPLEVEVEKPAHEKGYYMHPEAYDQPVTKSMGQARVEYQREKTNDSK